MSLFEWSDELSINKEIDNEHKKLISMVNRLYLSMKDNDSGDILFGIFLELYEYTDVHFTHEEHFLEKCNYPGLAAHRKIHQMFIKKVDSYRKEFDEGHTLISLEVINFLKNWLINHIAVEDQKIKDYI